MAHGDDHLFRGTGRRTEHGGSCPVSPHGFVTERIPLCASAGAGRSAPPSPPKLRAAAGAIVVKTTAWRPVTAPPAIPKRIEMDSSTDATIPEFDGGAIDTGVIGGFGPSDGRGLIPIALPHPPLSAAKPVAPEKVASESTIPKPTHVSKGVPAAKLIRQANPPYPPLARQARISGTVRLTAIIGP